MAVIVKYVVVRDGVEKMTFTTKKEADAYDKMLDIAENLNGFIGASGVELSDETLESLSMYLAEHRDQVAAILKGASPRPKAAEPEAEAPPKPTRKTAAPKTPRTSKKKA